MPHRLPNVAVPQTDFLQNYQLADLLFSLLDTLIFLYVVVGYFLKTFHQHYQM